MREHQLAGIRLRRRVKTTIAEQGDEKFPDLLNRDFAVGESGRRYVGDITYLPIADGTNLYLATCIDLGSRKFADWSLADHMRTETVEDALTAAWRTRGGTLREAVSQIRLYFESICEALQTVRGEAVDGSGRVKCR